MSYEKYKGLVGQLCKALDVPDTEVVLQRGTLEIAGFELLVAHYSNDEQAMYLNFSFGIVGAGKTMHVFQQMLQSNMTIYGQDQAQLGLNPSTGGILLIVRVPMTDEIDGPWLADTFTHYSEHGRFWRDNLHNANDEMYAGPPHTHFVWMRA